MVHNKTKTNAQICTNSPKTSSVPRATTKQQILQGLCYFCRNRYTFHHTPVPACVETVRRDRIAPALSLCIIPACVG